MKNEFLKSHCNELFHQIPPSHNARSQAVTLVLFSWHKAASGEGIHVQMRESLSGSSITELSLSVARRIRIPQRTFKAKFIGRLRAKKFETASLSV